MSKKIIINCEEATTLCCKNQHKEASFYDKIRLGFHVFLCKRCREFSKQNTLLTKIFGLHLKKCEEHHLSDVEKRELQKKIKEFDK
ncbi:hypothetical protein MWU59_02205 [Flavobacteriaceae bacterium F08102]|nr:hypothetical protein [Flavobacteriaceae bacterium F08102]